MEMGESVTMPDTSMTEDKCVVCGEKHAAPKALDPIGPTVGKPGWERDKSMAGVFDAGDGKRKAIYKDNHFPPRYTTQGHHSIAYSSFVKNQQDELPVLNHLLNEANFHPNDPPNIIHLPGPRGSPGAPPHVDVKFQSFWVSVDDGKPLQIHTGRHVLRYFASSDNLVRRLAVLLPARDKCKETDLAALKQKLKAHADGAVNYAFMCVTRAKWRCSPDTLDDAQRAYARSGGTKSSSAWPDIKLVIAPFR